MLAFDGAMAGLEPEAFIDQVVDPACQLTHLVIVTTSRSVRTARGTRSDSAASGSRVGSKSPACRRCGSTARWSRAPARDLLREGDFDRLSALLGRPYALEGVVVPGMEGAEHRCSTANVRLSAAAAAPGGVAVRVGFRTGAGGSVFTPRLSRES